MSFVVLLSGGIDSAVLLALFRGHGQRLHAIHFQHGQPNGAAELRAATALAKHYAVPLEVQELRLWAHPTEGSCLVPGRNAAMLAVAAAFTESHGGHGVVIGCNADDSRDYPDCRPEFIRAMCAALAVPVVAPLLGYTKRDVVAQARDLGVPLELTWTCYTPRPGQPCGRCNACVLREESGG